MKNQNGIIGLFNVYTGLSILISLLAWGIVYLGFVTVPEGIVHNIGLFEIGLGTLIFGLATANVWCFVKKKEKFQEELFLVYMFSQIFALVQAFVQQGRLFFPAAGSQGTLPAILISVGMYVYMKRRAKRDRLYVS